MADEPVATDQGMTNDRTSESSTTARRAQRVGAACCRIRRGKRRVDSCEVYCHLGRERGPPHEKDGGLRLWSRLCPGVGEWSPPDEETGRTQVEALSGHRRFEH
jgi:hypothetical protein